MHLAIGKVHSGSAHETPELSRGINPNSMDKLESPCFAARRGLIRPLSSGCAWLCSTVDILSLCRLPPLLSIALGVKLL